MHLPADLPVLTQRICRRYPGSPDETMHSIGGMEQGPTAKPLANERPTA